MRLQPFLELFQGNILSKEKIQYITQVIESELAYQIFVSNNENGGGRSLQDYSTSILTLVKKDQLITNKTSRYANLRIIAAECWFCINSFSSELLSDKSKTIVWRDYHDKRHFQDQILANVLALQGNTFEKRMQKIYKILLLCLSAMKADSFLSKEEEILSVGHWQPLSKPRLFREYPYVPLRKIKTDEDVFCSKNGRDLSYLSTKTSLIIAHADERYLIMPYSPAAKIKRNILVSREKTA